jgi:hypothetical protein
MLCFKYLYYRSIPLWKDYPLVNNWTIKKRRSDKLTLRLL